MGTRSGWRGLIRPRKLFVCAALVLLPALLGACGDSTSLPQRTQGSVTLPGKTTIENNATLVEYLVPEADGYPYGLAIAPNGDPWITEHLPPDDLIDSPFIGHLSGDNVLRQLPIPTKGAASNPEGITVAANGTVWFVEPGGSLIGKMTPTGTVTTYTMPLHRGSPIAIVAGPDGNMWFTAPGDNSIGRITPAGKITEFPIPTPGSFPQHITVGPDGNLWFTESKRNAIGRMTPSGNVTEFPLPMPKSGPFGITTGPDGNLWFCENIRNFIGRMTPSGQFTEYALPTLSSGPLEIAADHAGNIWFTEVGGNRLGRITPQRGG